MYVGANLQETGATPHENSQTLKKRKGLPELVWPGKTSWAERDLVHSANMKIDGPSLAPKATRGVDSELNSLILGDNRLAMSALLEAHGHRSVVGQVRLCYLDPPYNTGSQFSTYSDSKTSAEWLGDLHERLIQIRALLSADGSVWLHLDDSEQHHARAIMDEVFGREAFVSTVIWQKRTSRDNRKAFSSAHDYIHVYAPMGAKDWKHSRNALPDDGAFANPDQDPRGPWRSTPMSAQAGHATKSQFYTLVTPSGVSHDPPPGRCWTYTAQRLEELDLAGRVYWPKKGAGRPRLKRYANEVSGLSPSTIWTAEFAGDTAQAKKQLLREFPERSVFDTPKPAKLLERILSIATNEGDLVLDPYLGSATTALVSLEMKRRFIGIEESREVFDLIASPRISNMAEASSAGYSSYEVEE